MSPKANSPDEIFFAALGQGSPEAQAAYLDEACGSDLELRRRVERLLDAQPKVGSFLDAPAAGPTLTFGPPPGLEGPGTVIGPYKLLEQVGEGGMGVVYMAEQTRPVRRKVALKIIKPGMDTKQVIARFEAERQALALMDHPNIARVLDAGATESGRPYFVMELVRGVPITDYCDRAKLSIPERLALFVQVCQAVQHAHQKGVIHRDIKPSNILVTLHDGVPVPKVIDFGVAKAMGQSLTEKTLYTGFLQLVGTPLYMSPEQAEFSGLDIDTRSDIYSLGVLLYELLTGTTPFDSDTLRKAAFDEVRRIIREQEPPKPSTRISSLGETLTDVSAKRGSDPRRLGRVVRGELDWIVMKALEKDRNRRYETATGLGADVRRYLADEPVQACPPSAWYRLSKTARRHRAALVTAAVVTSALLLGTAVSTWQAVRARKAELRAKDSLLFARRAVDEMYTQVAEKWLIRERDLRLQPVQEEFLRNAVAFYERFAEEPGADPALRREAAHAGFRAAQCQRVLGARSLPYYRKAVELYEGMVADGSATLDDRWTLCMTYGTMGNLRYADSAISARDAERYYRRDIELEEAMVKASPGDLRAREGLCYTYRELGTLLHENHRESEAEKAFDRSSSLADGIVADAPDDAQWVGKIIKFYSIASEFFHDTGLDERVVVFGRRAVEITDGLPPRALDEGGLSGRLSGFDARLGDLAERAREFPAVEPAFRREVSLFATRSARSPSDQALKRHLARALHFHGKALQSLGRRTEAEQDYSRCSTLYEEVLRYPGIDIRQGSLYRIYPQDLLALGRLKKSAGQPEEAESFFLRAFAFAFRLSDVLREENPRIRDWEARFLTELGDVLSAIRPSEAGRAYRRAQYLMAKSGVSLNNALLQNDLAWKLATSPDALVRDPGRAVQLARSAIDAAPHEDTFWNTLGVACYYSGEWKAAVEALERSRSYHKDKRSTLEILDMLYLAMAHWQLGHADEARSLYGRADEWMNANRQGRWFLEPNPEYLRRPGAEARTLLGLADLPDDVFARP
jgi:serine/threonine protein kinase/tetratricopeptide (TPR) repeat protein